MPEIILMDSNERATNPTLHTEMTLTFGSDKLRVVNLEWGDFAIPLETGLLLIERKTANDLLNSIADGRIFRQIEGMMEEAKWCFVLLHGSLLYNRDDFVVVNGRATRWRGKAVRAALRSIQMSGCVLEWVSTHGCVSAVQEIIDSVTKPDHTHLERKRGITFRDVTLTDADREEYKRVEFIAALPGIGRKKAEALLSHVAVRDSKWGSVADAFTLISQMGVTRPLVKDLSEHWGKLTVERVRAFLGLDVYHYLHRLDKRLNLPVKLAKPAKSKRR